MVSTPNKKINEIVMINKIEPLKSRVKTAKIILLWFISKGVLNKSYRGRSLAVIFFQFLGNTILASSIVCFIFLFQNFNQSFTIPLVGQEISTSQFFVEFIVSIFFAILIGSFLIFWSRSNAISISLDFEILFSKKMTQSFGVLPLSILQGKAPFSKSLQAFHSTNSKHKAETARALRIILQIANPIVILIYSFIAMAFVNPIINLIFLAVVMLSMPLYYWAAIRAVRGAIGVATFRSEANLFWRRQLEKFQHHVDKIDPEDQNFRAIYDAPVFKASLNAVSQRLTAPIFSQFFANLGLALAFIVTIFLTVHDSDFSSLSINSIIVTAVLLQLILTSFRGFIQNATNIMRLFPSLQNCYQLWVSDYINKNEVTKLEAIKVRHYGKKLIRFEIGEILYVQLNSEIHRYNVGSFLFFLSGKRQSHLAKLLPNLMIVQAMDYNRDNGNGKFLIRSKLSPSTQKDIISATNEGLGWKKSSSLVSAKHFSNSIPTNSLDAYTAMRVLAGTEAGKKILLISSEAFFSINKNHKEFAEKIFKNFVTIVFGASITHHIGISEINRAFAMTDDGLRLFNDEDFKSNSIEKQQKKDSGNQEYEEEDEE